MSINPKQLIKRYNKRRIVLTALCAFAAITFVIVLIISVLPQNAIKNSNATNLDSLYNLGKRQMTSKDYNAAIKTMTTVGQYASSKENRSDSVLAVMAYNNAGVINFFNKNYAAAYSFYKHALEAGGNRHGYYVGTNLAYIHRMYNDIESAKKLLRAAYRHSKEANDTLHLLPAYYNYIYYAMIDDFSDSVQEMIDDFRSIDLPHNGVVNHLNAVSDGISSYLEGNYSQAIDQFKKAENIVSDARFPDRSKIDCELYIAQSFLAANRPDSALTYFKKAASLCDEENSTDYLPDIFHKITQCYDQLGQKNLALQSRVQYYNLRDSLFSFKDLNTIKNLDSDYKGREYEKQIAVVIAEKKRETLRWITALTFLLITLTLLIITFIQKRKLKESNITLFNKNIQLLKSIEQAKEDYLLKKEGEYTTTFSTKFGNSF